MNRRNKIIELRNKKFTFQKIAELLNVSRQRVYQIYQKDAQRKNKTYSGIRLKRQIKERDNYQCQWGEKCKDKSISRSNLIIHHIDYDENNNDPNNLITLCKFCHAYFHLQLNNKNSFMAKQLQKKHILIDYAKKNKLTIQNLANLIGISKPLLYQIINNKANTSLETCKKLNKIGINVTIKNSKIIYYLNN